MDKRLSVEFAGLQLRSPIILASSGITKAFENVKKADHYGAGAVVLKSKFEEELMAHSPTPRFTVIRRGKKDYCSTTNMSYEQGYEGSIEDYCNEIRQCKVAGLETKIIASIGCSTKECWVKWAKMVEEAGADAIEMNLSCPHSDYVIAQTGHINQMVAEMVPAVVAAVDIPVFSKMTPQLENPSITAQVMEQSGAKALTAFSRCLGMDIDIDAQKPVLHGGYGGHGGPWAIHYALRWISEMYNKVSVPISGCGGVVEGDDIIKYILAGSTTVQVCFMIYAYGYSVIEGLNQHLLGYMDKHGYQSVLDFRGIVTGSRIKGLKDVDRRKTLIATVDQEKCVGCKRCQNMCIFDGIGFDDEKKKAFINKKCDGCGLCPSFCPTGSISMIKR